MATTVQDTLDSDDYDEFALLHLNADEWGLPFDEPPAVSRHVFELPSGQAVSYLRWGVDDPELVLLHGAAQNAHTWDTVLLALGSPPALAVDMPGHGHSDWRPDRDYGPWRNAEAAAALLEAEAPAARSLVGMSNGGGSVIRLAARHPDLCRRAVLVDVTPGIYHRGLELSRTEQRRGRPGHGTGGLRQLRRDGRRRGVPKPASPRVGRPPRRSPQLPPAGRRTVDLALRRVPLPDGPVDWSVQPPRVVRFHAAVGGRRARSTSPRCWYAGPSRPTCSTTTRPK